jgi:hypothetical protein
MVLGEPCTDRWSNYWHVGRDLLVDNLVLKFGQLIPLGMMWCVLREMNTSTLEG